MLHSISKPAIRRARGVIHRIFFQKSQKNQVMTFFKYSNKLIIPFK